MPEMDRTVIVVNPAAGGGRAGRIWQRLQSAVPAIAAARVVAAGDAASARAGLAEEVAAGAERVLAIGGDGTAHLVVNVLLESGRASEVAFGLVPAGTGSDLARTLGLPPQPEAALCHALAAAPRTIDAVRVRRTDAEIGCFVVNTFSAGLAGAVSVEVNALPHRGRGSYLAATLRGLLRYRPVPCRVEVDGEVLYDGGFFLAAVTNGRFFGNGMQVAPRALLDDGLLDVVLSPPVPLWQLPYRLPQFLSGRHLGLPFIRWRRARRVRFEPAPGFPPFDVDGETLASGPAEVTVLPAALRVLA
jgi:diacylglycerol kinase (ATP)